MPPRTNLVWQGLLEKGQRACKHDNFRQAEKYFSEALILARNEQMSAQIIAVTMQRLSWVLLQQGKYSQCEKTYQDTLAFVLESIGINHRGLDTLLEEMSLLYRALHRDVVADQFARQAYEIRAQHSLRPVGERKNKIAQLLSSDKHVAQASIG